MAKKNRIGNATAKIEIKRRQLPLQQKKKQIALILTLDHEIKTIIIAERTDDGLYTQININHHRRRNEITLI